MNSPYAGQARDPYGATFGSAQDKNYNSAVCAPPPPMPQSPLTNVINDLRRKAATLESLVETMECKLGPILVSLTDHPPKESGVLSQPQSAVVAELGEIEYRFGLLCKRIDTLITRTQV